VHLACRIARASTGRARIAKMAGGFDGWYDDLAFGLSGSPEAGFGDERPVRGAMTLTRANDPEDLARLFAERDDIAAILVEPMLANSGCLELSRDYIEAVQRLARQHGAMIIADEVLMGLRLRAGPSSAVLGLDPDLITMGKAIGSGVAVAAVLGTHEGFSAVHDGRAARAGTYHGNPLAAAAVLATMRHVARADYPGLLARGRRLRDGLERLFQEAGHQMRTSGVDSAFSLWLAPSPPRSYAQALQLVQPEFFARLHLELRREGVLTIPGAWARLFVCFAHDDAAVAHTLAAYRAALARLG
jgi:glutamate-1-semialdehyde 2,1-aminomutase